jgi:arylformamidase
MRKIIYLNHILNNSTPGYGNKIDIQIKSVRSISNGDTSNESHLNLGNHVGTHIDAPFHFDNDGITLDQMNADFWICTKPFLIYEPLRQKEICTLSSIKSKLDDMPFETDILLLKTNFEKFRTTPEIYGNENPILEPEIALYLRKNFRLKFIGIDTISFGSRAHREMGRSTHKAFLYKYDDLNDPIFLIEDMALNLIQKSPSSIFISPLLYEKADGAPCTILAEI